MFKKVSGILLLLGIIACILIQFRNLHHYYVSRAEEYYRAQIYLESDVCVNGDLARKLGGYSKCEESRRVLIMSPWVSAWYDFLEDMYVCGHGRCDVFWAEISGKLPYIIIFMGITMCWIAYQTVQTQRMANAHAFWQLPLALNGRQYMNYQSRHDHLD